MVGMLGSRLSQLLLIESVEDVADQVVVNIHGRSLITAGENQKGDDLLFSLRGEGKSFCLLQVVSAQDFASFGGVLCEGCLGGKPGRVGSSGGTSPAR